MLSRLDGPFITSMAIGLCGACGSTLDTGSAGPPAAASCPSTPTSVAEPESVASDGENVDHTCAFVTGGLAWKTGAPGSACTTPLDCSPVCCTCSDPNYHALTSWCAHGVCAAAEATACMVLGTTLRACGQ
ncbi:MAG TPA: hypothetical protein VH142_23040 [Polyangiaceae bacterium]|nr:hypothetical protein [Polyangiaceae bacterium]